MHCPKEDQDGQDVSIPTKRFSTMSKISSLPNEITGNNIKMCKGFSNKFFSKLFRFVEVNILRIGGGKLRQIVKLIKSSNSTA